MEILGSSFIYFQQPLRLCSTMNNIVTEEDCVQLLKRYIKNDNFELINFKTKPYFSKGTEFFEIGFVLEINAKVQKNIKKFRFFIKKCPDRDTPEYELLKSSESFSKETFFFARHLPNILSVLPECRPDFAPQFLLEKSEGALIFEDLSVKYYVRAKRTYPIFLDRVHLSVALKTLAQFHASSIAYEEKAPSKDEYIGFAKNQGDAYSRWFEASIKGIKALFRNNPHYQNEIDILNSKFETYLQSIKNIMKPQSKFYNILCHGNLHTKNILFKYDGNTPVHCVLVGFQSVMYFLPAYDVLSMIFLTTHQLFRQHYFTYLLRFYYDRLTEELDKFGVSVEKIFNFEQFLQSVDFVLPLVKLEAALYFLENAGSNEYYYKLKQKSDDYRQYLFEDKSKISLDLYKNEPNFRIIMAELLEELYEILFCPEVSKEKCYGLLEKELNTTIYDFHSFKVEKDKDQNDIFNLVLNVQSDEQTREYVYKIRLKTTGEIEILHNCNE
ncbi:uncharacterized protein LOC132697157 [Cylas formicarius]|uniref:uncharacterized protein LOC132697157 n=1 Tax=Cylas formicarius TaxID=197179 RepID=UPI0029586D20|nr:uncharacterized protein LOC132697157 [Cylas formicarius]